MYFFYFVHIRALISLYRINTDQCTYILLNHHCINTLRNSKILQPLQSHLQGVQLISFSRLRDYTIYLYINVPCIAIDFYLNNQPDALIMQILFCYINSTCFGHLLCPSSEVFYCTFGIGKLHEDFWLPFWLSQDGKQFHPDSAWIRSSKTCMKLINAECTVENSWWWAEKMSETCRVL